MGAKLSKPIAPASAPKTNQENQSNHIGNSLENKVPDTAVMHEDQNCIPHTEQNSILPPTEQNSIIRQSSIKNHISPGVSSRVTPSGKRSPAPQVKTPQVKTTTEEPVCAKYIPCGPWTGYPDKKSKITGCVYLPSGYLVLIDHRNRRVKLFDSELKCRSFVDLEHRPFGVCVCNGRLYVTIPKEKEIQKISVSFPFICIARKLILRSTIKTEGECYGITHYRNDLIVGLKFPPLVTDISDFSWQIHIMSTDGVVKQKIISDLRGKTLFTDAYFIAMASTKKELIVSEATDDRVKGYNLKQKKKTFNHKVEEPKGLTVDKNNNVFVLGKYASIHWIEADRRHVHVLLQGVPSKISYGENITYNTKTNKLLVPRNENKVDIYKLKGKVT